jgi:poly-beta-1,6-N-acetyl-D-glucosamine synthase
MYSSRNITEDIDLSVRMQRAGMRIVYADNAIVYTEGAESLTGLMKQRLRWKRGRFQTFYEHWALFFSSNKKHNRLLTWVVLPMALFGDLQLFFEPYFLLFLYIYSFLTHDFSSFISGILVVASMFVVQMFDSRSKIRAPLLFLAPIGWLLFYITTMVEHQALLQSITGMLSGQKIRWQRWQRTGIAASQRLAIDRRSAT